MPSPARRAIGTCVALLLLFAAGYAAVNAQSTEPSSLALRSSIVVVGTVTRTGASEEPLLVPTNATAVIKISRMLAGSEVAGDQTGRTATVILRNPEGVKAGTEAIFLGNPRFIGKTLTIADEGELSAAQAPALAAGIQARRDAPIRARLAIATSVFRGTVEKVGPLQESNRPAGHRDEHDPEWTVALVRVSASYRGAEQGAVVSVIFPASRDIMWYGVPKLKVGETALILGHRPQESELLSLRESGALILVEKQRAVIVSHTFDVLPPSEEKRLLGLLQMREMQQ